MFGITRSHGRDVLRKHVLSFIAIPSQLIPKYKHNLNSIITNLKTDMQGVFRVWLPYKSLLIGLTARLVPVSVLAFRFYQIITIQLKEYSDYGTQLYEEG